MTGTVNKQTFVETVLNQIIWYWIKIYFRQEQALIVGVWQKAN